MNNGIIKRVIILGFLSVAGIIAMQTYWMLSAWSIHEEDFNKKVNLALFNTAKSIVERNEGTLPNRDIIKRKTSNYYIVNVEGEVNSNDLEYFLYKEFTALALYVDFEYAVFDCYTNEMVYGNFCRYNPDIKNNIALGDLAKDREFTYYFGVKFPTLPGFLIGKMQLSIFFSILLFFTVLFFAYSMFVILRQKKLSEQQKDFINNMTHEFKTPISTIKISAEVFLSDENIKEDKRLFQYAKIIKEQNIRLNNQVEKVLQISKIEEGALDLKKENINLSLLMADVIVSCDVKIQNLHGILTQNIAPDLWVKADKLHLNNILHNLLDNAIKYCGENIPEINVTLNRNDRFIKLIICDKGLGMAKEYQAKVFEKFYRIPTGDIHDVKGFGLGLYYVKSICMAHKWKINLQSEKNEGTCITIKMKQQR